jgi:hypothetical protein
MTGRVLFIQEISLTSYQTLEALTSLVAHKALTVLPVYDPPPTVLVHIAKPSTLVFAGAAEVQVRRTLKDFPTSPEPRQPGSRYRYLLPV